MISVRTVARCHTAVYNNHMKKTIFISVLFILVLLASCAPVKTSEIFALDSVCSQQVYGSRKDEAIAEVNAMLQRITREYATDGTFISSIDFAAPKAVQINGEALALIKTSLDIAALTDGSFEPTIGPVSLLWDISGNPKVPSPKELQDALELVDYNNVTLDGNKASLTKEGMILDLGGIAKGYAADLATEIYKKHGINSALINLGGNIYAFGSRTDGKDWLIGIRDPQGQPGEYAAVINVSNKSVVTSGNYERYFERDGKKYHHIFDPSTGYPVQNGLLAVTVVCENSTLADALSTALFVMGRKDGMALAERIETVDAVFITDTEEIYITDGLKESIEITNETYTIKS